MSCNHPRMAFKTGSLTDTGKDDYVLGGTEDNIFACSLAEKKGHHITPSAPVRKINGIPYLVDPIPVPCRDCIGCRLDRAKEWRNRCVLEADLYENVWFITLTYSDQHLPQTKDGQLTLQPSDMTKFLKRLRKAKGKCRYFYCGEYGSIKKTARPHYHMILFGLDFPDLQAVGRNAFYCDELTRIWSHGIVSVSRADPATIAYTTGYVIKKQKDPLWDGYPVKPFIRMSTRPALGSHVINDPVVKSTGKIYGKFSSSRWSTLPSCYVKKIGGTDVAWLEARRIAMSELGLINQTNKFCVYGTTNRAIIGKEIDEAQFANLDKKRSSKI